MPTYYSLPHNPMLAESFMDHDAHRNKCWYFRMFKEHDAVMLKTLLDKTRGKYYIYGCTACKLVVSFVCLKCIKPLKYRFRQSQLDGDKLMIADSHLIHGKSSNYCITCYWDILLGAENF